MLKYRMAVLATALAGVAMTATPSSAADPSYWDQPSPTFDWSGFYVGAHVGAGGSRVGWEFIPGGTTANHNGSGAFGGIQAGYNMQYDSLVFGAEADISYAGINGSTPCPNPDFACQSRINWLGSARLRAGFAFDQVMIYGTGGLGFGNVRMQTVDLVGALGTSGETRTRAGWTLGAGAEFAFADGWSLKGEYVYYDLGRANYTVFPGLEARARTQIHTGKIGVNFRW